MKVTIYQTLIASDELVDMINTRMLKIHPSCNLPGMQQTMGHFLASKWTWMIKFLKFIHSTVWCVNVQAIWGQIFPLYYQVLCTLPSYSWWKKSCTSCYLMLLQGFIHPRWLFGISESSTVYLNAHPKLVPAFIAPLAVVVPALATVGVITPFITIGLGPTLYHLSNCSTILEVHKDLPGQWIIESMYDMKVYSL